MHGEGGDRHKAETGEGVKVPPPFSLMVYRVWRGGGGGGSKPFFAAVCSPSRFGWRTPLSSQIWLPLTDMRTGRKFGVSSLPFRAGLFPHGPQKREMTRFSFARLFAVVWASPAKKPFSSSAAFLLGFDSSSSFGGGGFLGRGEIGAKEEKGISSTLSLRRRPGSLCPLLSGSRQV